MTGGLLIVGVDGGGSRSEARLWSDGREVARARGGAANPNRVGDDGGREALRAMLCELRMAVPGAGERVSVDAACVGLSGVSHPASRAIVQAALETAGLPVRGPCVLVSDAEIALEAAFGGRAPSGVLLVAGTGSIAVARDAAGRLARAGGRGPAGGDPGGGAWLGAQAVAAGVLPPPADKGTLADLAPGVLAAADAGEPAASAIVRRAAAELAAIAAEAAASASLGDGFEVRVSGGLAAGPRVLLATLEEELARAAPGARVGPRVGDVLIGALQRALRELAR